ncbi:MAG: alanine racemase, partial [Gemmatimonadaceae bacterium]
MSRRSFVAAAAAAALGARGSARGDQAGAEQGAGSAPRPNRTTFDPWLEIDGTALAHNVRAVTRLAGGRPIMAVVKNNAYGLGLETAAPILDSLANV